MTQDPFYSADPEQSLRFGDVISGCPSISALMDPVQAFQGNSGYSILINNQAFSVVLTPCCSIRDQVISVCPLRPINKNYLKAPKLRGNLLLLNEKISAEDAIPPERWQKMSDEEKIERQATGLAYAFNTIFIYAENNLLPTVELEISGNKESFGFHEIDFRDCFSIKTKQIIKPENKIDNFNKVAELTDKYRERLRDKLQAYFERAAFGPTETCLTT